MVDPEPITPMMGLMQKLSDNRFFTRIDLTKGYWKIPMAPHKLEGPLSELTFLGIEIDAVRGLLRLPEEKLLRLRSVLGERFTRRSCTKRELLSLIGVLHHAAWVVKPGRIFPSFD